MNTFGFASSSFYSLAVRLSQLPFTCSSNLFGLFLIKIYRCLIACRSIVVSAGLLRIFGSEAAELPIVATRRDNQGKVSA